MSSYPARASRPHTARRPPRRAQMALRSLALAGTFAIAVALRLWNLDRLPGELYGDIAIVYEYVVDIRSGRWPAHFVLSAGPLYHYAIMPVVSLAGISFLSLKLASVGVGLLVLGATYGLARQLVDTRLALLAVFIAAVSSWLLVFSRLGNSQILVPLLSTGAIWAAVRLARRGKDTDALMCAVLAGLGLLTYPQSFVLPPVLFVTLVLLHWSGTRVERRHLLIFVAVSVLLALPFAALVARDPANFVSGYIGGKLRAHTDPWRALLGNAGRSLLAFHVRGDSVFRSNPASLPHLDIVSGILFLVGVLFWLDPRRRALSPALFAPFVLLQLPATLVLSQPGEVPSASRTLAVAPLAYVLVASGLLRLVHVLRRRMWLAWIAVLTLLVIIAGLNLDRYFHLYARGLPDRNAPFGRLIAEYIDELPDGYTVYLVDCCWSPGRQPEIKSVRYVMTKPARLRSIKAAAATCELFRSIPGPAAVIWTPYQPLPGPQLADCAGLGTPRLHRSPAGAPVFHSATIGVGTMDASTNHGAP